MGSVEYDLDDNEFTVIKSNSGSDKFDSTIGQIEDIVVRDEFQDLQSNFLENNYQLFEDTEENKLEYFEIFKAYTNTIESFITAELRKRIPNFNVHDFVKELEANKQILDGEIFELLLSFSDFLKFKELILDYKAQKEGKFSNLDLSLSITRIDRPEYP